MGNLMLIIGSAKCGTTSVAAWLQDHPSFCLGDQKEPRFFIDFTEKWKGPAADGFADSKIWDFETYLQNFPGLTPDLWAVDASTDYIWNESATQNIAAYARSVRTRMICIVRDPVARAISEYNHTLRRNWETLSFNDALEAEPERIRTKHHPLFYHARRSTISADIARYRDEFGDDLLILDYEDLRADPNAVMRKICDFAEVPFQPVRDLERKNESKLPRNRFASFILNSPVIRKIAHPFVSTGIRGRIWQALHTNSRNLQTVTPAEESKLREILKDEIDACIAAPYIPTDNWSKALIGR